jgi:excisionase family DNA binding protein
MNILPEIASHPQQMADLLLREHPDRLKPLTTRELAERLSVSTRTIQAWRDTGKLPHIRITARSFRYVWEQVELWLAGKIIDAL